MNDLMKFNGVNTRMRNLKRHIIHEGDENEAHQHCSSGLSIKKRNCDTITDTRDIGSPADNKINYHIVSIVVPMRLSRF